MAEITLTNETARDDVGMYPDGAETPSDMIANLEEYNRKATSFALGMDLSF